MAPQGQGPRPSVWSFSLFLPLLPPLPLLFRASCVCYLPRAVSCQVGEVRIGAVGKVSGTSRHGISHGLSAGRHDCALAGVVEQNQNCSYKQIPNFAL